ncbi:MAG TPA: FecR family protein, partial [Arenicellales bacterium]|nr:FecR family protein [Arenicellales bacterium]
LGKQDAVNVGETVRTGAGGYVVIEFVDGARATVRPNSELQIDRYAYGTGDDGALMSLVKGGLRAITGSIAHDRPESYKVRTNVATLGVRGTEFALRICEQDCSEEAQRFAGFSQGLEGRGYTVIQ